MGICVSVYGVIRGLPAHERFNLGDQIRRAVISIPANIAEGASKSSQKDFNRFIEISLGSSYELESLLLLASELYPEIQGIDVIIEDLILLDKQMHAFKKKLISH